MNGSDGIEEAIAQNIRVALRSAERLSHSLSKVNDRIQSMRERRDGDDRRPSELELRYEAARGKALERLSAIDDPGWPERATPRQMADLYMIGKTWSFDSPEAQRASQVIRSQALERYGRDVDAPRAEQTRPAVSAPGPARGPGDYGTRQHRTEKANALRATGFDPELADAHARADTMNARPPRGTVMGRPANARLQGPRGTPRTRTPDPAMER